MAANKIELVQIEGIGLPDGVATLDGSGKVPASQLPPGGGANGIFDAANNGGTVPTGFGVNLTDTINFGTSGSETQFFHFVGQKTFAYNLANDRLLFAEDYSQLNLQPSTRVNVAVPVHCVTLKADGAPTHNVITLGSNGIGFLGRGTAAASPAQTPFDFNTSALHEHDLFHIKNNSTSQFLIDKDGNTGIGTALPSEKFHVVGNSRIDTGQVGIRIAPTADVLTIQGYTDATNDLFKAYDFNSNLSVEFGGDGINKFFDIASASNFIQLNPKTTPTIALVKSGNPSFAIEHLGSTIDFRSSSPYHGYRFRRDGGTDLVRMDMVNERVGIGTALPSAKLHVVDGDIRMDGTTVNNVFYLDHSTNNIGIRTATPTESLDMVGNFNIDGNIITEQSFKGGLSRLDLTTDSLVRFGLNMTNNIGLADVSKQGGFVSVDTRTTQPPLSFWTRAAASAVENKAMVIDTSANVGIGTALPSRKLHVANGGTHLYGTGTGSNIVTIGASTTQINNAVLSVYGNISSSGGLSIGNAPINSSNFATSIDSGLVSGGTIIARQITGGITELHAGSSGQVKILDSTDAEIARFDASGTAGDTRFMIYDVDNGTVERVTVGAADSGGTGFKVLRIPN